MIERTLVDTYRLRWLCDEKDCHGEMKSAGITYLTAPVRYVHKCDCCGKKASCNDIYPKLEYEYRRLF